MEDATRVKWLDDVRARRILLSSTVEALEYEYERDQNVDEYGA